MKIITKVKKMQDEVLRLKRKGFCVGFVPTMGYLHEGHLSLMRQSKAENDLSVISIFVNPLQFAPDDDLKQYPRDFKRDSKLAKSAGVDIVFFPDRWEMYKKDFLSEVYIKESSQVLCSKSRPDHFKGVTTVVAKLFNIVSPDIAYFGQKDFQQARIIEKMVVDLNFPVKIKFMPIVREFDGLAMSSRNVYLSASQRQDALILYRSLNEASSRIRGGVRDAERIISSIKNLISSVKSARIDYVEIVGAKDLRSKKRIEGEVVILLALRIGSVRLIDNRIIKV